MYSIERDIFEYEDFRQFLKDCVEDLKVSCGDGFSHRKFAEKAGFSTPNFLILLVKGERNLSFESAEKIAKALGLQSLEKNFFHHLVGYNQSKKSDEKYSHAYELVKLRSRKGLSFIAEMKFEYYSTWIHVAVRELLLIEPNLPIVEMAQRLRPQAKEEEIQKSLELLIELGFVTVTAKGREVRDKSLTTGENFSNQSIVAFHKKMMSLGAESLDRFAKSEREISASTVPLSKENFEVIRQKIQDLRLEILALSENTSSADEVFQINFQMFPLTKKESQP